MKEKFIRNASAAFVQQIINQLFGLVIFYILSRGLSKELFGQLNWVLAFLLLSFNMLSFGIDQLVMRKAAAGTETSVAFSLYVFHVLFTGCIFYGVVYFIHLISGHSVPVLQLLLLIGAGKLMVFFSMPFKHLAAGLNKFHLTAYMSVCSNVIRGVALAIAAFNTTVDFTWVVIIFIAGDVCELLLCLFIYHRYIRVAFSFDWRFTQYRALIKEAAPLIGVALFTSVMSRFDWLFIGLFISDTRLAEYSFAYKAFELSTLPLMAVGPLLIPAFTRYFKEGKEEDKVYFRNVLKMELATACFISVMINILWTPVIDPLTGGKYGAVNSLVVFILSLSSPLLYINNFLWTILFVKGNLRKTFSVIGITCGVNVAANLLLIPLFKNEGAAAACLIALLVQLYLYRKATGNLLLDYTY